MARHHTHPADLGGRWRQLAFGMMGFMNGDRSPGVTLANWDLGGEPSAWAYLNAGELLPTAAIPVARAAAELQVAEQDSIGRFAVGGLKD